MLPRTEGDMENMYAEALIEMKKQESVDQIQQGENDTEFDETEAGTLNSLVNYLKSLFKK